MQAIFTGRGFPMRSVILAAAREWGCPPWIVEEGPAEWLFRWAEENSLRAEMEKKK